MVAAGHFDIDEIRVIAKRDGDPTGLRDRDQRIGFAHGEHDRMVRRSACASTERDP